MLKFQKKQDRFAPITLLATSACCAFRPGSQVPRREARGPQGSDQLPGGNDLARRKPRLVLWLEGSSRLRLATRAFSGALLQEPWVTDVNNFCVVLRRSASGWIPRSLASIAEVPSQLSHSGPLGLGWRESAPGFGRLPVAVQLRLSVDAGATHGAGRNYAATILVTILVQCAAGAGRSPGDALRRRPERAPMQDAGDTFAPSTPSEADRGVV
jgi:hypothetical protein